MIITKNLSGPSQAMGAVHQINRYAVGQLTYDGLHAIYAKTAHSDGEHLDAWLTREALAGSAMIPLVKLTAAAEEILEGVEPSSGEGDTSIIVAHQALSALMAALGLEGAVENTMAAPGGALNVFK